MRRLAIFANTPSPYLYGQIVKKNSATITDKRTERIEIRVTAAEKRALERAAEMDRASIGQVSTWARRALMKLARKKSRNERN